MKSSTLYLSFDFFLRLMFHSAKSWQELPSMQLGMQSYKYCLKLYKPILFLQKNVFKNASYAQFKKWLLTVRHQSGSTFQCPNYGLATSVPSTWQQKLEVPKHKGRSRTCPDAFNFRPSYSNHYIFEELSPITCKKLFYLCMHSPVNAQATKFTILHGYKLCLNPYYLQVFDCMGQFLGVVYVKVCLKKNGVYYYLDSRDATTLSLFVFNTVVDSE